MTHSGDRKRGIESAREAGTRPRFPMKEGNMKKQLRKYKTKLVFNNWIPKLLGVGAITIYPWVFIANKKEDVQATLVAHEMIHIWQVRQHGWFSFYISYLLYWLAGLIRYKKHKTAYRYIPYEVMAYARQDDGLAAWMEHELKNQIPEAWMV